MSRSKSLEEDLAALHETVAALLVRVLDELRHTEARCRALEGQLDDLEASIRAIRVLTEPVEPV